jgi:DNA-binding transcriptional LysR family regulator
MEQFAGIEAFAAVVERGSFTAAAAALRTAKSSVSEAVRALEDRMGVRLLERTTRKVKSTDAGSSFYRHCRRLLDDMAAARDEAQAAHKAPVGQLRVTTPHVFAERFIIPGLPAFYARHPTMQVELIEGTAYLDLVEHGLDLAIRIVEKPEPNLVVRRLASQRIAIVASPSYLAAAGTPRQPRDLQHHRLIGFTPRLWRDNWRIGRETVAVKPALLTDNTSSLRAAALAGLGLTAVPDWLVSDAVVAGQLVRVFEDHDLPTMGIYAVYPTNRLLAPRVRVFVDHIARDLKARGLPR